MKDFFDELIDGLADIFEVSKEELAKQDRIAELMVEKREKYPKIADATIKFLEEYGKGEGETKPKAEVEYPKYVVDSIDLKDMEDGCYGICDVQEYAWGKGDMTIVEKVFKKLGSKVEYFNDNFEVVGFDYIDTCAEEDGYLTVKATYCYSVDISPASLLDKPINAFVTTMTKDFYKESTK